jgi:hypothetical protein
MHEYPLALCTVMLLELVPPVGEPPAAKVDAKHLVHELLVKSLRGLSQNSRIAIEDGSGALVCFMGDPEEALRSALLLRDLLSQRAGKILTARIALNIGSVRVIADDRDQVRVDGHGVHLSYVILGQVQPGEVLVSHSYHDLLTRLNPDILDLFQYRGPTEQRPLEVYSVIPPTQLAGDLASAYIMTRRAPMADAGSVDPAVVEDIESELAGYIGPLAHVLVRKARALAQDGSQLRSMLAPAVQNLQTHDFFLEGKLTQVSLKPGHRAEPENDASGPALNPSTTRQVDIAPAELAIIAHTLQRYIGDTAQPLMRREIDRYMGFPAFVQAIAASISHPEQREVFLRSLRRALPERSC